VVLNLNDVTASLLKATNCSWYFDKLRKKWLGSSGTEMGGITNKNKFEKESIETNAFSGL